MSSLKKFFPLSFNTHLQPDETSVEMFYQMSQVARLRVFAVCFLKAFSRHFQWVRNSTFHNGKCSNLIYFTRECFSRVASIFCQIHNTGKSNFPSPSLRDLLGLVSSQQSQSELLLIHLSSVKFPDVQRPFYPVDSGMVV